MKKSGFTLVEILVAQFLLIILLSFVYFFWQTTLRDAELGISRSKNIQDLSSFIRTMTDQLREARDSEEGGYLVYLFEDQEIGFYSDIDDDGQTERVRYFLDGEELKRGVTEAAGDPPHYDDVNEVARIIGDGIKNEAVPIFSYYNKNYPGDAANNPIDFYDRPLETRVVGVELLVGDNNTLDKQMRLTGLAHLRNLKDNY